jgi:hypothetical protein
MSALLTWLMRLLESSAPGGEFVVRQRRGALYIIGIAVLAGCRSAPRPEPRRTTTASATVRAAESSQTKIAQADDDCGLSAFPASRSTKEILAAVPRAKAGSQSSTMLAKVAIDRQGRISHLRVLSLAYPELANNTAINAQAVEWIKRMRHAPVIIAGEPVVVCSDITVTIDLQ